MPPGPASRDGAGASAPPGGRPRVVAHEVLLRVEETDAFADVLLATRLAGAELPAVDQALATRLVYGTLAWQGRLDFHLGSLCARPLASLEPAVRVALRLGAYQLLFLDRVPAYAAVDGSVRLVPPRARGFVNAVLRRAARAGRDGLPLPDAGRDAAERLAVEWSHPRWLVERWLTELGDAETRALLAADQDAPATTLRANRLRTTPDTLAGDLATTGVDTAPGRWAPDALTVAEGAGRLRGSAAWRAGRLTFQSEASQLVGALVAAVPGARVLDACAAPGGKAALLAAAAGESGTVVALDPHPRGARRVAAEARRLGARVHVLVADARRPPLAGPFDAVLVDAPCTGLGTLRRHPELKWRRRADDVARLARLQRAILAGVAELVRPGGVLVYAVCTVTRDETDGVVATLHDDAPGFAVEHAGAFVPAALVDAGGAMRTFPHRHGLDGFFAVRLRRGPRPPERLASTPSARYETS